MGQLIEWPEVVIKDKDLEDCRTMLRDDLNKMIMAYRQQDKELTQLKLVHKGVICQFR